MSIRLIAPKANRILSYFLFIFFFLNPSQCPSPDLQIQFYDMFKYVCSEVKYYH